MLRYLRPSADFRETFQYNNLMFKTLSYLPKVLLNQTYETNIKEDIFKPLNMTASTFSVVEAEARGTLVDGFLSDAQDSTKGKNGTLKATALFLTSWRRKDVGRSWCLNLSTRPGAFFTFSLDSYFMVNLGGLDFDVVEQRSSPVHE